MSQARIGEPQGAVNIVAIVKGNERYVVMYADEQKKQAFLKVGQWACHPDLSFSWYDAAVMSASIRGSADEICYGK